MLKKVTTNITYRVPAWQYCRHVAFGTLNQPAKEMCRFCIKDKNGYRCALYNTPLDVAETVLPIKTRDCEKAVAGFKSIVEDVDDSVPEVDPKIVMKATLDEYNKLRKKFIAQGYPQAVAEQVAQTYLLGGN